MTPEKRAEFAKNLRRKLDTRRDTFTVDKYMFEPYSAISTTAPVALLDEDVGVRLIDTMPGEARHAAQAASATEQKALSAATLKLLLDYCESAWDMDFVSYCAGIFHGREPREGETAFDLLPDVRSRISADRLGFGHIYGGE